MWLKQAKTGIKGCISTHDYARFKLSCVIFSETCVVSIKADCLRNMAANSTRPTNPEYLHIQRTIRNNDVNGLMYKKSNPI